MTTGYDLLARLQALPRWALERQVVLVRDSRFADLALDTDSTSLLIQQGEDLAECRECAEVQEELATASRKAERLDTALETIQPLITHVAQVLRAAS